jgi:protein gp37
MGMENIAERPCGEAPLGMAGGLKMGNSKIEWCDRVWNPVTGCTRVSAGCDNCYAKRMHGRFHPTYRYSRFEEVEVHSARLQQPVHWKKAQKVFVDSMGDLFHEAVPDEFIDQVFAVMALCEQHTFQVLTKRPERMVSWSRDVGGVMRRDFVNSQLRRLMENMDGFPKMRGFLRNAPDWPFPNVWLGVSVEDQKTADERIPILLQTPAAIRFVSVEPMLGPVDLIRSGGPASSYLMVSPIEGYFNCAGRFIMSKRPTLDWVICGGESGPGAWAIHPGWARSLRDQCQAAGVPFFFKQWGEWVPVSEVEASGRHFHFPDGTTMRRAGKKVAGRLLDGRELNEFPNFGKN